MLWISGKERQTGNKVNETVIATNTVTTGKQEDNLTENKTIQKLILEKQRIWNSGKQEEKKGN
jgi:hypothetical protein